MACWAYGVLRKRQRPAGWKQEPRLGALSATTSTSTTATGPKTSTTSPASSSDHSLVPPPNTAVGAEDGLDVIRFEQWNTGGMGDDEDANCDAIEPSATDILFDKISETLLEPLVVDDGDSSSPDFLAEADDSSLDVFALRIQNCR